MSYPDPSGEPAPARGGAYTYSGPISWEYSPELDRDADPGEIVWTWVAFEEDAHVGKDRPVAVVGRADDGRLVALMLSSKEHDGDRGWISIGTGPWDKEGRESWVRRDRVLAVHAERRPTRGRDHAEEHVRGRRRGHGWGGSRRLCTTDAEAHPVRADCAARCAPWPPHAAAEACSPTHDVTVVDARACRQVTM